MKFNFRKIASVLSSAVMLSSTVALAAAANFPAPFVQNGAADVAIVYGSHPAASVDLAAVTDIQAALSSKLSEQAASTSTSTSVSGEAVDLGTSSQKIYMNSSINAARSVLTDTELPTILADGQAQDLSGTNYDYTQQIDLGDSQVTFSKSGESIDPVPMVSVGTTATDPIYNYSLTLVKTLNVSSSDVIGNAELVMQGVTYTVGANSDYNTLYLYGSGVASSVDEGETKTVEVGGVSHTVTLKGASSTTAATIIVDDIQKSVTKGSSYKFSGDFEVYVKDVFYTSKTGTLSNIDLLLGANTLHLESGQVVRKGADDDSILKTKASIVGTNGAGITKITIEQAAEKSTGDYLSEGNSYTDRVLGGGKVQFAQLVPPLGSTDRDEIVVDTDNSVAARVKFTSELANEAYTLTFAKDADGVSDSVLGRINLVDDSNKTIHVVEGANAATNELVVINAGDKGRILELTQIGSGTSTNDKTTYEDVITSDKFDFATGVTNTSTLNIDGYTYTVATSGSDSGTANITWGAGSSKGYEGSAITVFPRIKLNNGEWMAILGQTTLANGTTYALPGEDLLTTYEAGDLYSSWTNLAGADGQRAIINGNINWTIDVLANVSTLSKIAIAGNVINFNRTYGPAILVLEEDTLSDSNGNAIVVGLTREGTTTIMPAIGTPYISDGTSVNNAKDSDNSVNEGVDVYGTLVSRDTDDNNVVTISYPDEQMYAKLLVTEQSAVVSGTAELGEVTFKDSESESFKAKNLIVVGGSCVNSVAAMLLGSDTPLCGADWEAKTGVGADAYLIATYASPYSSSKVATLVAGYNAIDTTNAAKALTTDTVSTAVGAKVTGP